MTTTEELVKKAKSLEKQIQSAQSEKDRLTGEQSQLKIQGQEIIKEVSEKFNCSVPELADRLPEMKKELEAMLFDIEEKLKNYE